MREYRTIIDDIAKLVSLADPEKERDKLTIKDPQTTAANIIMLINGLPLRLEKQRKQLKCALIFFKLKTEVPTTINIYHLSMMLGSIELKDLLIGEKLLPEAMCSRPNSDGLSPFMVAVKYGRYPLVEDLLKKGEYANSTNSKKELKEWTSLNLAIYNLDYPMVKLLMETGAKVTYSSLQFVAKAIEFEDKDANSRYDIAKYLIERGANVFARNKFSEPLNIILQKNSPNETKTIELFEKEIEKRKIWEYNFTLFKLASHSDLSSTLYSVPTDIINHVSNFIRTPQ